MTKRRGLWRLKGDLSLSRRGLWKEKRKRKKITRLEKIGA